MIRIGLVGASGYVGGELVRWLQGHPHFQLSGLYASQDRSLHGLFPNLRKVVEGDLKELDPDRLSQESDAVLLALPHESSAQLVEQLLSRGTRVVDMSGEFRLHDLGVRQHYYGAQLQRGASPPPLHPPQLQRGASPPPSIRAVYGLPELHRKAIATARLVANPGCYPTAAILALTPLAEAGLIDAPAIVDAKSGVSGAGRPATATTHFCQVNENIRPYSLGVHRHQPEMEQELGTPLFFSPHLVPMTRGILATCYVRLKQAPKDLLTLYRERYADEPFIRVLQDELPQTRATYASNFCDLAVHHDPQKGLAVVVAALDNLVKGAAGQAVQNLNLMFNLPETAGLWAPAIFV